MKAIKKITLITTSLLLGCILTAIAGTKTKKSSTENFVFAPDLTFEERNRRTFIRIEAPLMVYPGGYFQNTTPIRLDSGSLNLSNSVWQTEPLIGEHQKYLSKRDQCLAHPQGILELANWCRGKELHLAAEYELRNAMTSMQKFRDPFYQKLNNQWLRYSSKRQISFSLPLPLKGEWHVVVDKTGHHRIKHWAAYAFDFVIKRRGRSYRSDPRSLKNHYAWGKEIIAQADGIVTHASGHFPDMAIGKSGGYSNANIVNVNYGGGIYCTYGHLQQGSVPVKVGQRVKRGQLLGRVGNSGASGIPHLHYSVLDYSLFSIKGRYHYQVHKHGRWRTIKGKDLKEGTTIRNIKAKKFVKK